MNIVLVAVDEALVNSCPRKALETSAKAQGRCVAVGDSPLATAIAAVGLAQITAEHRAELLDVVL